MQVTESQSTEYSGLEGTHSYHCVQVLALHTSSTAPHHVPESFIQTPLEVCQAWCWYHFPGEPVTVPEHHLGEKTFSNTTCKSPWETPSHFFNGAITPLWFTIKTVVAYIDKKDPPHLMAGASTMKRHLCLKEGKWERWHIATVTRSGDLSRPSFRPCHLRCSFKFSLSFSDLFTIELFKTCPCSPPLPSVLPSSTYINFVPATGTEEAEHSS